MNLKTFTELVDHAAQEMNQEQLKCLIHSIARKIPEEKRDAFVVLLNDVRGMTEADGKGKKLKIAIKKVDETEIRKEMNRLKRIFRQIENGELCVHADGYEDYSMGYGGGDWVWEYEDEKGICRTYADGCRLLVRCVNDGFYKEAVELFDIMMKTEVLVENDWDDFSMDLHNMQKEGLISVNLENLGLYVLYASYKIAAPESRAQDLYDYFSIPFIKKISLEDMLGIGREDLEDQDEFWESWIRLLIDKSGDTAQRLLEEAVLYQGGEEELLSVARLGSEKHPSLYLKVLQSLEQARDNEKLLEIGKEALEKVEKKYVIRSEIALKTAEAAIALGREDEAELCWLEAFISHTTPVNYLRLMMESQDGSRYQKTARDIIFSANRYVMNHYNIAEELSENTVSDYDRKILRFLSGDFDFIMDECRSVKVSLGWSSTFMKYGVPMLLLLLLEDETLKQGCTRMAEMLRRYMEFEAETYYKGTKYASEYGKNRAVSPEETGIFWQCFRRWKPANPVTNEQAKQYLLELEDIIDRRIRAIVSGQFRAHYSSVAGLAAALGEVKESRGEAFAKEQILQKYKEAFPRHNSFRAELRANGMADTRSNKKR